MRNFTQSLFVAALASSAALVSCSKKNDSVVSLNMPGTEQIQSKSSPEQQGAGPQALSPQPDSQNSTAKTGTTVKTNAPALDLSGLQKLSIGGNIPAIGEVQINVALDGKIVVEKISKDAAGNLSATPLVEINKPEIIGSIIEPLKNNLAKVPELIKPFIPAAGTPASMTIEVNGQKLSVDLTAVGDAARPMLGIYTQILTLVGTAVLMPK